MCTAVVGGSIHRAARSISAASDQTSTTPMATHRAKNRTGDRRKRSRSDVLGCGSGLSVTFQNNGLGWVIAYGLILRTGQSHEQRLRSWMRSEHTSELQSLT